MIAQGTMSVELSKVGFNCFTFISNESLVWLSTT